MYYIISKTISTFEAIGKAMTDTLTEKLAAKTQAFALAWIYFEHAVMQWIEVHLWNLVTFFATILATIL